MDDNWKRGEWDSSEDDMLRQAVKDYDYWWTRSCQYTLRLNDKAALGTAGLTPQK